MKHLLLTTIAAVVLVGCGESEAERALFEAAAVGNIEAVKQAIADGADVNAKNYGMTPLNFAAMFGHTETAELLIDKGADVNAKDDIFGTPLDLAERVSEDDSPEDKANKKETADLLRKHGGKTGAELKAEGK